VDKRESATTALHGQSVSLLGRPAVVRRVKGCCAVREASVRGSSVVAWAAMIAALTRRAYADSDPLPGLPSPDGARDTAAEVARDLRRGARVWTVHDHADRAVAALRVIEHADANWELRRISVLPAWRGHGLARALITAVEAQARQVGVRHVWLNAVIERCRPPVYAHLGYRTVRREPSYDKPLTEVIMERQPAAPHQVLAYPWQGDITAAGPGLLVSWFMVDGRLLAAIDLVGEDVPGGVRRQARRLPGIGTARPRLAGVDLWSDAGDDELAWVRGQLMVRTNQMRSETPHVYGGRAAVQAHLLPRTLAPELFALWRFAPGREPVVSATRRAEGA